MIIPLSIIGLLFSLSAAGQERQSFNLTTVCSDWIETSDGREEVKNCSYSYNNQPTQESTMYYRDKHNEEVTKVENSWDGEAYETFTFIYSIDGHYPVRMNHFHGDELYKLYDFTWQNGEIVEDEVFDGQKNPLRHSSDVNGDGKIDHITRYDYNAKGELIEKTIDKDGDGYIDAKWDFKKEEWKPVKVYKPKYF